MISAYTDDNLAVAALTTVKKENDPAYTRGRLVPFIGGVADAINVWLVKRSAV